MKNFAYLAAITLAVVAQAASAAGTVTPTRIIVSSKTFISNAVFLTDPAAPAIRDDVGLIWKFGVSTPTIDNVKVAPSALKSGLICHLSGERYPQTNQNFAYRLDCYTQAYYYGQ